MFDNKMLTLFRRIDIRIEKTFESITLKDFIKFLIGPTVASIGSWWFAFALIDLYQKASYAKETIMGITIAFTILYYIIGFCKMIPNDKIVQSQSGEKQ